MLRGIFLLSCRRRRICCRQVRCGGSSSWFGCIFPAVHWHMLCLVCKETHLSKKVWTVSKNWHCRQSFSALNSHVRKPSACDTVVRLICVFVFMGVWWRCLFVVKWVAHCWRGTKFAVFFMHWFGTCSLCCARQGWRVYWISWFLRPRYSNTPLSASTQYAKSVLKDELKNAVCQRCLVLYWPALRDGQLLFFVNLCPTCYSTKFCDMCHFHLELLGLVISVLLFVILLICYFVNFLF